MNEVKRIELLKKCNEYLNNGMITESDFNKYKNNVLSTKTNLKYSLEDFEEIHQLYLDEILSEEAYRYLKDQYFELADFKTTREISSLKKAKELLSASMINAYDYDILTDRVIKSTDKKTNDIVNEQLSVLDEYYPLISKDIITSRDYELLKNIFISGKTNIKPTNLISYYTLYKQGVISYDWYVSIKDTFVSKGKTPDIAPYERLKEYKIFLDNNLITENDFECLRQNILQNKPVNTVSAFDSLYEYKEMLEKELINNEDYNKYKSSLVPEMPKKTLSFCTTEIKDNDSQASVIKPEVQHKTESSGGKIINKKKLALIGVGVFVTIFFLICVLGSGYKNPYVGKWIGRTLEWDGNIQDIHDVYGQFDLELHTNGTGIFTYEGGSTTDITWKETADGISLNDGAIILKKSGDDLVLEDESIKITLVRKENYTPYENNHHYSGGTSSNSKSSSSYDDWDTDDNGTADWRDVDTDNDGNVSDDEMQKYMDDWDKEENYSY